MQFRAISRGTARITVLAAAVLAAGLAEAGEVRLRWDPVPGASGYKVYVGHDPGDYFRSVDMGSSTTGTVYGLNDCQQIFIAVKAYNPLGESETFSNEIVGWPRPAVAPGDSMLFEQGGQFLVELDGSNFQPGAELIFGITDAEGNPLVRVDSIDVVSCNRIQALLTVEPTSDGFRAMEIGTHDFHVRNPDSVYGTGDFTVELDRQRLDINRSSADTRDRVDGKDLVWMAFAHGAAEGEERFNADADLNGDGNVDGEDLAFLASEFGACWSGSDWTQDGCN